MNPLAEHLQDKNIIIASASPRREELLRSILPQFSVKVKSIDESYPNFLRGEEIPCFIAKQKAKAFQDLKEQDLIITSDTIVWLENKAFGKPINALEAYEMLIALSGKTHEVITSVCITSVDNQMSFQDITQVTFNHLEPEEIQYYIKNYKPFDKAGSYGIQEWIGHIGIKEIKGNYFNVVGLPLQKLYDALLNF